MYLNRSMKFASFPRSTPQSMAAQLHPASQTAGDRIFGLLYNFKTWPFRTWPFRTWSIVVVVLSAVMMVPATAVAQSRRSAFAIKSITPQIVSTPEYEFQGDRKRTPTRSGEWLEVEVEFESKEDFTEELTFNYYVLIADQLLVGEVTHVNIPEGRGLYSVMYVPPRSLERLLEGRAPRVNDIRNIAVEIRKQGAIQVVEALDRGAGASWWQTMTQVPGLLVAKNQTPFAPLFWDRYEAIKADR